MEREKALNLVRQYKENWTDGLREAIEVLIPELRESKDERTRRELVDFINHYRHNTDLTEEQAKWCKRAIGYLEKQKDRNIRNTQKIKK